MMHRDPPQQAVFPRAIADLDHCHSQLGAAIQAAVALTIHPQPLRSDNDARLLRLTYAQITTGIAAIPELLRLLAEEATDTLVFVAIATGAATPEHLATWLESDEITITERLHREQGRQLDTLDQRLADVAEADVSRLQLTPSGPDWEALSATERDALTSHLLALTRDVHRCVISGDDTVATLLTTRPLITRWLPSILINLDRQITQLTM